MISMTDAAISQIEGFIQERGSGVGIRFGVKGMGCSGFGYTMDIIMADDIEDNDTIVQLGMLVIVVDPQSLEFVHDTEIDFVTKGLSSEFIYKNPNSSGECGCGSSFTVKQDK